MKRPVLLAVADGPIIEAHGLAKRYGAEDLEALKGQIRERLEAEVDILPGGRQRLPKRCVIGRQIKMRQVRQERVRHF